jgi:hypothetical protein
MIRAGQLYDQVDKGSERIVRVLDVGADMIQCQECHGDGTLRQGSRPYSALRARFDAGRREIVDPESGRRLRVGGGYVLRKDVG